MPGLDGAVLSAHGLSDKGPIRPVNEDCFAVDDRLGLCVVADGLGGHNAGEVASRIAVDTVVELCGAALLEPHGSGSERRALQSSLSWPFGFDPSLSEAGNLLRTSVHTANVRILETADSSEGYAGMGTTIVAALVQGGRLSIAHVGDSRLYVFAGNRLRLLTRDDSWVIRVLSEDPQADIGLFQNHPMRNALTNVVGAGPRTDVHIIDEKLEGGELLLLTTDGVHGVLDDRRIEQLLTYGANPAASADRLIETALARGTRDNCTAIVAQYVAD